MLNYNHLIILIQSQKLQEAEAELSQAIRKKPLEAQLWVMLGETLLLQQQAGAAKRVFDRAWLLDPQAKWVNHIYKAMEKIPVGELRQDIEDLLYVPKVTVTAAILSRNEAADIAKCIVALQGAVDEILLVDSSTDDTRRIAMQYPKVKVVPIEWEDNFGAARNIGLQHVHTDWVIWIDADEVLITEDVQAIREVASVFHHLDIIPALHIWHLNRINGTIQHDFSQVRMFPAQRGLRYYGRIHEQIGTEQGIYQPDTYRRAVKIRLDHIGYDPAVLQSKGKLERNLRLLKLMVEEEPENPGHWLYYGRESLGLGQEEQALTALLEAERLGLQTKLFGRMSEIYRLLIQIVMQRKNYSEAEAYCHKALAQSPDFPDAHYLLAQVRMRQADELLRSAEVSIKQSLQTLPNYRGSVSADYLIGEWKAPAALGELAMRSGKLARAEEIFNKLQDKPGAKEMIGAKLQAIETERQKLNQPK
ncbi:glycosyltransferase [Paenibacillus qinlingensis]|uniref:Glycosyltransferase involved in cell wall biosynthesis n=1 Tax=Paenibacillus qinlingensis TaxID=1837343 RepID=A0ABU1NNC4_9BACL|nr:glycosyltransferase [Paenibacillus qinlingensis]MDR6548952.1 glycosyltransferase involved in cell wall biosynthesis [Paenibacillus qinlingensis]